MLRVVLIVLALCVSSLLVDSKQISRSRSNAKSKIAPQAKKGKGYKSGRTRIDWRAYQHQNWLPWVRNQYAPNYCDASWAFATTTVLASKAMIQRGNLFPHISLSPQLLLDCAISDSMLGCNGGSVASALNWISLNGIVQESCNPYEATDYIDGRACVFCTDIDGAEVGAGNFPLLLVNGYGLISGETAMMTELSNGPIICSITTNNVDSWVAVVGFGDDGETNYWIVEDSRGMFSGGDGFFRVGRGSNSLNIESECYWATFNDASLSELDASWATAEVAAEVTPMEEIENKPGIVTVTDPVTGASFTKRDLEHAGDFPPQGLLGMRDADSVDDQGLTYSPLPDAIIDDGDVPISFGWYNIQFTTFNTDQSLNCLTAIRQQHMSFPDSCASDWAFAATSMMADRVNVLRYYALLLSLSGGAPEKPPQSPGGEGGDSPPPPGDNDSPKPEPPADDDSPPPPAPPGDDDENQKPDPPADDSPPPPGDDDQQRQEPEPQPPADDDSPPPPPPPAGEDNDPPLSAQLRHLLGGDAGGQPPPPNGGDDKDKDNDQQSLPDFAKAPNTRSLYPEVNLSPQVLINVYGGGGGCLGGYASVALKYLAYKGGVPHESCQNYQAVTNPHQGDARMDICYTCDAKSASGSVCRVVETYENYTLGGYGYITDQLFRTTLMMQKEIYLRGPISCAMMSSVTDFIYYTGGIFSTSEQFSIGEVDHIVSVVGWGEDSDGVQFWVARNSWGVGWGENGYFRIVRGSNMLNIESECIWGVPTSKVLEFDFDTLDLLEIFELRKTYEIARTTVADAEEEDEEEQRRRQVRVQNKEYFWHHWLPRLGIHSLM